MGSCIGVLIYDPEVKVGGLLHYMLPDATIDKQKAVDKPFMFATTGVPRLFKEAYNMGASKNRLLVKVVGGAQILDSAGCSILVSATISSCVRCSGRTR